ncbi:MAG TPA: hypothetical protein VMR06_01885 [Dokdonella sp.]|uniref:hypothetical protein n=1 Tax=Dokdonella sp. TaxID=2291710 RepID=UPI002B52536F|nr:hypothetical protein [Dokdonella sp.]HUD40726.1 hypothetical protein [Dokdonella sp.]
MNILTIAACAAGAALIAAVWIGRRRARRARVLRSILDRADAFEERLQTCRRRLADVPGLVAAAGEDAAADLPGAPIDAALRDLLAHRLWLREHAARASITALEAADAALARSLADLQRRIEQLDDASADLRHAIGAAGGSP